MRASLTGLAFLSLFVCAGCGGSVTELPAEGGGPSTTTPEEMKKQMEESMKKSAGKYKGNVPGSDPKK